MSNYRKRWSGVMLVPQAPDLVLSALVKWVPDNSKKYSTLNGYEPNNITAAAAWTKIPSDLIASDAFIYKDKKTGLWVQAVGYPLIPLEKVKDWVDLQMANGAEQYWTNLNAVPRLPQKPYTQREVPGQNKDEITYIEVIAEQNKFMLNGQNLIDLNPLGRPKDIDIYAEPAKRKTYIKRDPNKFEYRKNSKFLMTPKGVYQSISSAAADMGLSFCGLTYHLKKNTSGFRYISAEEYLLRSKKLNNNEATE